MRNLLHRLQPVFNADGGGSGGGDGGNGAGDGNSWKAPDGIPAEFLGANADETLGKLFGGYQQVNTRAEGLRQELSRKPAAPEKADLYTFDPGDKLKPYFGDLGKDPAFLSAREAAHKHGLSQDQFAGFIADVYSPLVEQGVLSTPFDPANELKTFQTTLGLDQKSTQESLVATETFAKGLSAQLKDIPTDLKNDVDAMLLGMTDTAAGNILLRALSSRLADSGLRIGGEGGDGGALTAEDLKKLDGDPRIDPRNRDHKDPQQRFDEGLRKQYDDAYARVHGRR